MTTLLLDGLSPDQWAEYDAAADWCAVRGLKGKIGDPLPEAISLPVAAEIDAHPEAFEERVRAHAYARAMNRNRVIGPCPHCGEFDDRDCDCPGGRP